MSTLHVDAPGGRYSIIIGRAIVDRVPGWIRRRQRPSSIVLITDRTVDRVHGKRLRRGLDKIGVPICTVTVPAGERSKSVRELERVWRTMIRAGVDRRALVVAFGGGVVGDLAGFAAASVLRGVRFLQIPTTLLAMVDSSVGGKTGINLPEGKNLVGSFYQPEAVFIDVDFLDTLPRREVRAGWAEIIKTAAIRDARLFGTIERHAEELSSSGRVKNDLLVRVVRATCRIKAHVVSEDEKEAGLRMILNFGHTFGHGLEAAVGYRGLLHGEAVAIGMAFAARFGHALGRSSPEVTDRLHRLLRQFRLPVLLPSRYSVRDREVTAAMLRDKKVGPKGPRWVIVERIGRARIYDDVPWEAVVPAVKGFLNGRSLTASRPAKKGHATK